MDQGTIFFFFHFFFKIERKKKLTFFPPHFPFFLSSQELRARTNLQQPAVARMLKALETRGLVKSVRSVANGSRKVYMLRGLEPAREVTGGAWYTGH